MKVFQVLFLGSAFMCIWWADVVGFNGSNGFKWENVPEGLSRSIKPLKQRNFIFLYFPNGADSSGNGTRYEGLMYIEFTCLEETKRFAVHQNPMFFNDVDIWIQNSTGDFQPVIGQESEKDLLYLNMLNPLQADHNYTIRFRTLSRGNFIDLNDDFGIRAYPRVDENTGDRIYTVSKSGSPNSIRRFIYCFDDSMYKITYIWKIHIFPGDQKRMISLVNAELDEVHHFEIATSFYFYKETPPMVADGLQFSVIPLEWYDGPQDVAV